MSSTKYRPVLLMTASLAFYGLGLGGLLGCYDSALRDITETFRRSATDSFASTTESSSDVAWFESWVDRTLAWTGCSKFPTYTLLILMSYCIGFKATAEGRLLKAASFFVTLLTGVLFAIAGSLIGITLAITVLSGLLDWWIVSAVLALMVMFNVVLCYCDMASKRKNQKPKTSVEVEPESEKALQEVYVVSDDAGLKVAADLEQPETEDMEAPLIES